MRLTHAVVVEAELFEDVDRVFVGLMRAPRRRREIMSRDIADLIKRGILKKDEGGGRSTSYSLAEDSVK